MALSLDCLGNPKDHHGCPYKKELEGRGDDVKAEQSVHVYVQHISWILFIIFVLSL